MEEQTEVEVTGLVHDDEEVDTTRRNAPPPDEPLPPQPTQQDFSSLLFMMQQQMQSQNNMYQAQLEYQKLQTETVAAQNKSIDELKKEVATAKSSNASSAKPTKPVIKAGQTDNQWLLFLDSWERYKNLANLSKPERVRDELRAVCADEVNELLFELHGPQQLNSMTEDQLLAPIHKVAVDCVHEEVHRQSFFRMKQDIGEPIKKFMARLKA